MSDLESADWASEQLATADFGDERRRYRAKRMLRRMAEAPAGRLTEVFSRPAELQAAYDFVEGTVPSGALVDGFAQATLRAGAASEFLYVIVDGTSLSLTDRRQGKDFGSIGQRAFPTRGLKVIDAIAVDPVGVPLGLLDLEFWTRGPKTGHSRFRRRRAGQTEMKHFQDVIERVDARVKQARAKPWFVIDREGDCADLLRAVARSEGHFTVRAAQNRRLWGEGGRRHTLLGRMRRQPVLGRHFVAIAPSEGRTARVAVLEVRVNEVVLDLPDYPTDARAPLAVNVVWVRERHVPRGQQRLEWMLLTDRSISTYAAAIDVVESYCHRWRVEDFHRTWKRGRCKVEETQLHRRDHVVRWATMLASVALRIEKLKHFARSQPQAPATVGFTDLEITALRSAKIRLFSKRTDVIPNGIPNIATAVLWLAQWGGYIGKSSGGPPGSLTIGRGLQRLIPYAEGYAAALKEAPK